MANRQVARVDDGWYGRNHSPDDEKNMRMGKMEDYTRGSPGPYTPVETEVQKAKRFMLPMEPTESVDKTREYPPIVTVDGRVDTDIDHLMENAEEDAAIDTPVQDIPSPFPKPHVVRVIDGSLDDDIDNLVNHDGTMAHTLVDAPKNFNRSDLKEINSSRSPSSSSSSPGKKENSSSPSRHHQSSILNRMNRDSSEEDGGMPATGSGSKVVPYYERNNSSKAPTINNDDADFCHLKQSLEDGFVSLPPDMDKLSVTFASNQAEYLPVYDRIKESENDFKSLCEKDREQSDIVHCDDNCDRSTKSEDMSEAENGSDLDKGEVTEAGDISREASVENQNLDLPYDSISQVVEQFLKTMSKEELEKRLGIGTDIDATPEGEKEVDESGQETSAGGKELIESMQNNCETQKEINELSQKSCMSTKVSQDKGSSVDNSDGDKDTCEAKTSESDDSKEDGTMKSERQKSTFEISMNSSQTMTSESHKTVVSKESNVPQQTVEVTNSPSMQETIALLKQSLEIIAKDSSESSQTTESQKMLAVTALKVAGESMTAAAKMADALTLLVQSSQAGNKLFGTPSATSNQVPNNVLPKPDAPAAVTMSEPAISKKEKFNQTRIVTHYKERMNNITLSPERNVIAKIPDNFVGDPHIHETDAVEVYGEEEEEDERRCSTDSDKRSVSKEKYESEEKSRTMNENKIFKKHREYDDRSLKEADSKGVSSKGEYKKIYSDRKRRDVKQNEPREDRHRKRSSRKAEEVIVIEETSVDDERYSGSQRSHNYRDEADKKRWEHAQKKQRSREHSDEIQYEHCSDNWMESDNLKERSHYELDGGKRREKKKSSREEHHKKSRSNGSSPHHRNKSTLEIPIYKAHDVNESHSPAIKKSSRSFREGREDSRGKRTSSSRRGSVGHSEEEEFVRSEPWTLPNGEQYPIQGDCYFDQVVRQLKPYSPTRNPNAHVVDPQKEYFRAKLVGSCVDPHARDSDFDSIEFNANARPSESTQVHFDDEDEWNY